MWRAYCDLIVTTHKKYSLMGCNSSETKKKKLTQMSSTRIHQASTTLWQTSSVSSGGD